MGELDLAEKMAFWVTAGGGDRVGGADILGNNLPGGVDGHRKRPEANFAFRAATGQEARNGRCSQNRSRKGETIGSKPCPTTE